MRKKFIPLSLALCLTLSGCGGNVVLERSYSVSTPHSEVYWENEGADTLRADSYQDAVNAILMLVANHAERGVVRCYFGSDAEYAELAAEACNEVQQETDLGAYLLDYITYAGTAERGFYELSLSFGYRRTAEEQEGIINATSTEAIPDLLRAAAAEGADTALLPETWNTGFFPADHLPERSDRGGEAVKALCAPLARELNMNIVAGSVSDRRGGRVYNTAYVFDRQGACLAAYDKTHLFTPMGEHEHYAAGDHLTTFSLDGHKCGLLICYDLRFPELFRTLALQGVELLLLPAQWPAARRYHWETLTAARAIENQFFLAACNSCGTAGETVFGGASRILGPRGELLAAAGASEEIVTAALDFSVLAEVRNSINVFHDRRPELYRL